MALISRVYTREVIMVERNIMSGNPNMNALNVAHTIWTNAIVALHAHDH